MDPGQLPGARVRAPSLGPRGRAGRPRRRAPPARQGDLDSPRCEGDADAGRSLPRLRLRRLGARRLPRRRARLLQRHRRLPARRGPRRRAARARAGRPARRAGTSRRRWRRSRRAPARTSTSPPTTTSSSTIRSSSAASGAAASTPPASPHEFVVAGALPDFDGDRLLADTERICETEIAFWHGRTASRRSIATCSCSTRSKTAAAVSSTARARRWSRARRDLPRRAGRRAELRPAEPSDGYVGVLGLIAHEYFHAWNVKRLKPRDFAPSTTAARTTPSCSGSSRASLRTTTTCWSCAAA